MHNSLEKSSETQDGTSTQKIIGNFNLEKIKDYLITISEGKTMGDKLILLSYFIKIPVRIFYRIIGKIYQPLLSGDVTLKNKDGIFYCGSSFLVAQGAISTYESENRKYLEIPKDGVFIDIGANIGKYSIIQGKKLTKGKVIAIEPSPEQYEILEKNIKLNNLGNVIPIKLACSDSKGNVAFWLGCEGAGTANSLIEIKNRSKKINIKTDTLDNILKKLKIKNVNLIKIDVEGAEPNVFRGANLLLKKHPKIIFEALTEEKLNECKNELLKFNYKIKKISDRDFYAE